MGSGNKTVVIVGGDDIDPPAYAPSLGALANGPCTGKSGGVSLGILGAASLGAQYADEDEECTLRYNIALLHELGMTKLAIEMTNDLRGVKEAMERLVKNKAAAAGGNVATVVVDGIEIDVATVTAQSGKFSPDGFEYRADAPYWRGGKRTTGITGSDLKACFGKEPKPSLLARVFGLE